MLSNCLNLHFSVSCFIPWSWHTRSLQEVKCCSADLIWSLWLGRASRRVWTLTTPSIHLHTHQKLTEHLCSPNSRLEWGQWQSPFICVGVLELLQWGDRTNKATRGEYRNFFLPVFATGFILNCIRNEMKLWKIFWAENKRGCGWYLPMAGRKFCPHPNNEAS